jgi:hypothetical protein
LLLLTLHRLMPFHLVSPNSGASLLGEDRPVEKMTDWHE